MRGLFATPKDVQIVEGINYQSAWEKYQVIKAAFNKAKHQKVLFSEFLEYFGITESDYHQIILSFKQ